MGAGGRAPSAMAARDFRSWLRGGTTDSRCSLTVNESGIAAVRGSGRSAKEWSRISKRRVSGLFLGSRVTLLRAIFLFPTQALECGSGS